MKRKKKPVVEPPDDMRSLYEPLKSVEGEIVGNYILDFPGELIYN